MLRWFQAPRPRQEASRRTGRALGMLAGGRRIVQIMDSKITRRSPQQGSCAETGGAPTPFMAAQIGVLVSTTDTIAGDVFRGPAR